MGINSEILQTMSDRKLDDRYTSAESSIYTFLLDQAKLKDEAFSYTTVAENRKLLGTPSLFLDSLGRWSFMSDLFDTRLDTICRIGDKSKLPLLHKYAFLRKQEYRHLEEMGESTEGYVLRNENDLLSGLCTEMELRYEELTREI